MMFQLKKTQVSTANAPAAIGPYSQAVVAGPFVFTSGQLPVDPKTNELVGGDAANQAKQVFENLKAVLAEAGTDLSKVVKATVFLKNMDDFAAVNESMPPILEKEFFLLVQQFRLRSFPRMSQ